MAAKKTGKRPRCPCCKHAGAHCSCKVNRPPRQPPQPVTVRPVFCQLKAFYSLAELAWHIGQSINTALTVHKISGAIRALGLKNDKTNHPTDVIGCVVYRQQTMVFKSKIRAIQQYIIDGTK